VFINLEMDPHILYSSPHHACVNLPPPIVFGLPLTSALGHCLDSCSCPCSDAPRTPTHVHARTLLRLLLMSMLRLYLELRSSSVTHPPLSASQKYLFASLQSHTHGYRPHLELHVYPHYKFSELHSEVRSGVRSGGTRTSVSHFILQVQAHAFGPRSDLRPCPHYDLNPCHPTWLGGPLGCPLGHPCLTLSYKFEPVPSGLLGPPSLSMLRVLCRSELLVTRTCSADRHGALSGVGIHEYGIAVRRTSISERRMDNTARAKPVHESESSRVTRTGNPLRIPVTALLTDPSLADPSLPWLRVFADQTRGYPQSEP
jgi:hypothetical protein